MAGHALAFPPGRWHRRYAGLHVREVIIIDRNTKRPEIYMFAGAPYVALQPNAAGWLRSETMGVALRGVDGPPPRLVIEDALDPAVRTEISALPRFALSAPCC